MVRKGFSIALMRIFMRFALRFAAFCLAFSTKMPRVLHQNGLRFAPKWLAFSTKMQCVLQHIAQHFAVNSPKVGANCSFMQCTFILHALTTIFF